MNKKLFAAVVLILTCLLSIQAVSADPALKVGWYTEGGKTFYGDVDLQKVTGFREIEYACYYFNSKGVLQKNGLIKADLETYYYANQKGELQKGLKKIGTKRYFFDPVTRKMRVGKLTRGKYTYYFRPSGKKIGQAVVGWLKVGGIRYYFDSKGRMVTGWKKISGKKYYFDPESGALLKEKEVKNPTGPWMIKVNQTTNTVTVYRGETPVKAFACSVGVNNGTPCGTFSTSNKLRWHTLFGIDTQYCYGQYVQTITGNILFHSVPYRYNGNNRSLYTDEYNKLGQAASHGCIRLACGDAKYLYDNCPTGTKVVIFYGKAADDPLGKPMPLYVGSWTKNYDPTDPNI